jgi:arylformamidase
MPRLIDISPRVSSAIGVWPGDVPFRRNVSLAIENGAGFALSSVTTTLHVGAHADAPSHYVLGGAAIDTRPLELYYGPCQVIAVDVARGARIGPRHVRAAIEAPRVLFATGTFPDARVFSTDFASLSPELVDDFHGKGVVLVGIDTPSVDPFDDKELLAHHALARHDMANLEGLVLAHVSSGLYTLVALPLAIEGADASPVRAALVAPD